MTDFYERAAIAFGGTLLILLFIGAVIGPILLVAWWVSLNPDFFRVSIGVLFGPVWFALCSAFMYVMYGK